MTHRCLAVALVGVIVLPTPSALAEPNPPSPPSPPSPRSSPSSGSVSDLVPGVSPAPSQPWSFAESADAPQRTYDLIEYVPLRDAAAKVACSQQTGPYQRQVEYWLKLKVDGKQSASDCVAIRAFQRKYKIKPSIGFAGPVTWSRMQLLSARKNPNAAGKCPVRTYRVACVDLGRQLTWVQKGKKVVLPPVPVRSGRAGYATRGGWHKVYWKHRNHHSTLYDTPMPYSQFFSGGQAFHGVHGSIYTTVGSMGCVNMRLADARTLWGVLKTGDRVYVWGKRAAG